MCLNVQLPGSYATLTQKEQPTVRSILLVHELSQLLSITKPEAASTPPSGLFTYSQLSLLHLFPPAPPYL